MDKIRFIWTKSVDAFKKEEGISVIDLVRNPKTSKLFFTCNGEVRGAASEKVIDAERVAVSLVEANDKEFLLLHAQSSNNVVRSF